MLVSIIMNRVCVCVCVSLIHEGNVCVSPSFHISLVPIIRVACKSTNADKHGPLSFQLELVIKSATPVVTAGNGREEKLSALKRSATRSEPVPNHRKISLEKNNMFFLMLQLEK